jgi:DNA repair protein SbcC/Rad50
MRIQRVIARAFGPFRDEELELAPGLTVVVGPNEAGKSTWHAATRLAITGVRRGRGRATAADAAVEARHRPWDAPERWEVEARLALEDGRLIDISQDLAGKVACRAVDVALGRDVSDEILDGTPDASRWLGLDRESFAATVSVSQAQIASVANAETAELLQEHMQRAAATRGTDATAAEAIERLKEFRRQAVGADTVAAKGPLRGAKLAVAQAATRLEEARGAHARYLERAAATEAAEHELAAARRRLDRAEAVVAAHQAAAARRRLARAEELSARHRQEPAGPSERDARADAVAAALEAWGHRPRPIPLEGPSAADLERAIAGLAPRPEGDTRPHPVVAEALRALDLAEESQRAHEQELPTAVPDEPVTTQPVALGPSARVAWLVAGILAVAGGVTFALGNVAGLGLLVAAALAAAGGWWLSAGRQLRLAASDANARLRAQLAAERQVAWEARRDELARRIDAAAATLRDALAQRGAPGEPEPRAAAQAYLIACQAREAQAAEAAGRESLERELVARRAAEASAAESAASAEHALASLRDAVRGIGGDPGAPPEALLDALRTWQRERAEAARSHHQAAAEWQELRALLANGSLDDLRSEATRTDVRATELASGLDAPLSDPLPAVEEADLARLRGELSAAQQRAADLAGGLREVRATLPDVAEAEEALAAATAEIERVEALATTIDTALRLLRAAEERVHRDLAPILAESVRRWLPVVSRGAYLEVSVDPADLSVRVKEASSGQWRDARLLSEGTREQIYLLLRVAMAQHLVRPGEVAPLLLDEVTAQSDGERKRELLAVLHELSRERQVILFSHDDEVAAWAERSLATPQDALVRLTGPRRTPAPAIPVDGGVTLIPVG